MKGIINISEAHWNLMVQVLSGNADNKAIVELEELLANNNGLSKEFESLKVLWNSATGEQIPNIDIDNAWQKVQTKANISYSKRKERRMFSILLKIAAVFVITMGVWSVFNFYKDKTTDIIAENDLKVVQLPDGSIVDMYKGSKLSYNADFNKKERGIILQGEAFFSIAHNRAVPFVITAGHTKVRVTGTAFMVRIDRSNDVDVTVQSGSVEFSTLNDEAPLRLVKGDKGYFNASSGKLLKYANADLNYDSWKTKKIIFKNTPIQEVLKVINKTYLSNIEVNKDVADSLRLTATFEAQSLLSVQKIIEKTFAIELISRNDQ